VSDHLDVGVNMQPVTGSQFSDLLGGRALHKVGQLQNIRQIIIHSKQNYFRSSNINALRAVILVFSPYRSTENNASKMAPTSSYEMQGNHKVFERQPNTALLCLILALGTFFIAYYLRQFRNSKFLGRNVSIAWCVRYYNRSSVFCEFCIL
jgi:hypothetical protein